MNFQAPLTPDQMKFEEEFSKWEDGFRNWREQNAHKCHLDSYKNYMDKFLDIRDKLLEKRAQVYANRSRMSGSDIRTTFQFQLSKAERSAEDILRRYPAFDDDPVNPIMNPGFGPPMRPMMNPMMNPMMMRKRNALSNNQHPAKKMKNGNQQPPQRVFSSNIEKYRTLLREAQESGEPKKCSGHMQILFKRLQTTKTDKSTWTEEENALSDFCEYIYKRRREIIAEKKAAAEAAATEGGTQVEGESSTLTSSTVNDGDTVMTSV